MDLKNKLSEEEYFEIEKEVIESIIDYCHEAGHYEVKDALEEYLEKNTLVRKSAKMELDEYVDNIICISTKQWDKDNTCLKQLISAALKEAADLYMELLMAVQNKYPNETRHQTALRLIIEGQKSLDNTAAERAEEGR